MLITAHWDHKGIGPAIRGDSIYNGAEDNASGVAAMLGAAKALTALPRPARSIVFLATTAEESGLLGSEGYVQQPLLPLAQTAAVLNLDVTNVRGATRDIGARGADRSTLGLAFEAAARVGLTSFFSVPNDRAVGAALMLHASSVLPTLALGFLFLIQDGLDFSSMQKLATAAAEGEIR